MPHFRKFLSALVLALGASAALVPAAEASTRAELKKKQATAASLHRIAGKAKVRETLSVHAPRHGSKRHLVSAIRVETAHPSFGQLAGLHQSADLLELKSGVALVLDQDTDEVLNFAFLNSFYQTGLKNLLDRAVLTRVELAAELKLKDAYRKVDEIPFDFERRRMSVVVAVLVAGQDQHHELIRKGAVEEVLAACTHVRTQEPTDASLDGERSMPTLPLDAALLARTQAVTAGLNAEGLRVVAVAVKTLPPGQATYSVADESGLTLIGYIAFLDPPKESASPALKKLTAHGITVKVLTGDNDLVTRQVCRQVGLPFDAVLLGSQVEALNDEALKAAAESHSIFAKLSPLHKERIVRALRASGHVRQDQVFFMARCGFNSFELPEHELNAALAALDTFSAAYQPANDTGLKARLVAALSPA